MSGFPLGVARRAIDEFTSMARTKFRGNPFKTVAGNDHTQMSWPGRRAIFVPRGCTSTTSWRRF